MNANVQSLIVLGAYLCLLIGFGLYQGRKVKTDVDYAIAGRKLPGWVAALSERATDSSAWMLVGFPGAAYALGISSLWTLIGCVIGIVMAWYFLVPKMMQEAKNKEATTYIDWMAKSFPENDRWIRLFGGGGKHCHFL